MPRDQRSGQGQLSAAPDAVEVDGCSRREDELADSLEETGSEELADGSFHSVALFELVFAGEEFADQLVVGETLGKEGEDEVHGCALVPEVFGLGRAEDVDAMRFVMHGMAFPPELQLRGARTGRLLI